MTPLPADVAIAETDVVITGPIAMPTDLFATFDLLFAMSTAVDVAITGLYATPTGSIATSAPLFATPLDLGVANRG